MFKAITFSTQNKLDSNKPIDIGLLVECMLFYKKTTVIANQLVLAQLIRYFGVERLLLLMQEDIIDVVYTESFMAIMTNTINGNSYHSAVEMTSPQHAYQDELRKICINISGKDGKGRRLAQKIQDKIHVAQHDEIILEGANRSILDQGYVEPAARIILKELVPEFANDISNLSFHTEKTNNGIAVVTNINFATLNDSYRRGIHNDPYHRGVYAEPSVLNPALILSHLLDAEKDLYFASTNLSELASCSLSAQLAEQKIDYILARSLKSSETRTAFTSFIFKDAKTIREAVNSDRLDLDELISVLLKSKRFKVWLTGVKPDANLIKSYYEEVTKDTIADKLPTKSIRWALFTSLGLAVDTVATGGVATAAGIAIGALDSFYIDKLITGWKPNQFIEEDVKKLF